jgi:acetyl esterase/lipase
MIRTQYDEATAFGEQVYEAVRERLTMTGHSLGGGLASAAALATDVRVPLKRNPDLQY